jgi:hypothetical protein
LPRFVSSSGLAPYIDMFISCHRAATRVAVHRTWAADTEKRNTYDGVMGAPT